MTGSDKLDNGGLTVPLVRGSGRPACGEELMNGA
jgi:hypothetical protein